MDELERLAAQSEADEKAEQGEREAEFKAATGEPEVSEVDRTEAAETRAESILRMAEGGVKLLVDSRIQFTPDNMKSGRAALGGVIEKYDLQGGAGGHIPLETEVRAGFFIGQMIKTVVKAKRYLNAVDKKATEQQQEAKHGEKREHATTQPAHSVLSEIGVRENSDAAPPFRNS